MYRAPDEPVLFQGPADHHDGQALVAGRVEVTPHRFVFRAFAFPPRELDSALGLIARVAPCSIASPNVNGIELLDDRGSSLRFLVDAPLAWVEALGAILATYGRPPPYR